MIIIIPLLQHRHQIRRGPTFDKFGFSIFVTFYPMNNLFNRFYFVHKSSLVGCILMIRWGQFSQKRTNDGLILVLVLEKYFLEIVNPHLIGHRLQKNQHNLHVL